MKNGKLSVRFSGNETDGYAYRLVAVNDKAEATYGDIVTGHQGKASLTLPSDTKNVYLVVTGYPPGKYEPYTFNPYEEGDSKPQTPHTYKYAYKIK